MSVIQVGLVDTTGKLDAKLVHAAAAAINVQVTRDLREAWDIRATVIHLPHPTKVPAGVWPVRLVDQLPPGTSSSHMDKHNQPYAQVIATTRSDAWTIAASHETLEMLVDPYGNRLHTSTDIEIVDGQVRDGTGQFSYLVEACDPCESVAYAYPINGIAVSDFITPHFYDAVATTGHRYSFTGAIKAPRQVLLGGYISWLNHQADKWQQLQYVDPTQPPSISDLGQAQGSSLRMWIDSKTTASRLSTTIHLPKESANHPILQHCKAVRTNLDRLSTARAKLYHSPR